MASSEHIPFDDERSSYKVLANSQRRHALHILRKSDSPMALADLAADIAIQKSADSDGDIDWERIKRIHTALYHNHIPRFEEMGVVEFNTARTTVTLSESASSPENQLFIQ